MKITKQVEAFYKRQMDFHAMIIDDIKQFTAFMFYIYKMFDLSPQDKRKPAVFKCIEFIRRQPNDYPIYMYFRQAMINMGRQTSSELEAKSYKQNIEGKLAELLHCITEANIDRNIFEWTNMLDIGTERLQYLTSLEDMFHAHAFGININVGFCHYDREAFTANANDSRFSFYDGQHINAPPKHYKLITMLSVIHHIPTDAFRKLSQEIYRVCSGYLFIKDVDIIRPIHKHSFRVQHYLYGDGFLIEGGRSYFNDEVTFATTNNILSEAGFECLLKVDKHNFNGTYYAIFKAC